ncbi:MAG: hypothetical protein GTO02_23080, partial [Candidatus Dadabacteria bacterium]|nr:hypothetical protein [Candidatus Dadabacteria bacterium]
MLSKALEAKNDGEHIELDPLFKRINQAIDAVEQHKPYQLSWHALMRGEDEEDKIYREFIFLQPILNYGDFLPAQAAIKKIRQIAEKLQLNE